MTLPEELSKIRHEMPEAWEYLMECRKQAWMNGFTEAMNPTLPEYDDNDDLREEDGYESI